MSVSSPSHDELVEAHALQRALERRESVRRSNDARFVAEKRQYERRAETLQAVLSDADDKLLRQSTRVSTIARESAALTAESTRQLTARNAAASKLAQQSQRDEAAIAELEARNEELNATAAQMRMALAQAQVTADERQQQSAAVSRQLHDEASRQGAIATAQEAQRSVHYPERRKLEARVAEQQRVLNATADATREVQTAIPAADAARNERRAVLRRQIDQHRERGSDDASVIRSLRALLAELVDGQEEAARHRRRAHEEEVKDRVAARRQASQAHASALSDLERRVRVKTDALVDEAQSAAAHLSLETLPELRDACKALFVRELELRDECSAVARQTVGQDALRERIAIATEQLERLRASVDDLTDQCEVAGTTLAERSRRVDTLRDAVAPLEDVSATCADLEERQRELSKKLSDDAADAAIWRVRAEEEQARLHAEITGLDGELRLLQEKRVAEQAANDANVADLEAELRELEAEGKGLSERIDDTTERNKALDTTLEHIARQRRAIAEEMAERRNAARAAAASLLSQLE